MLIGMDTIWTIFANEWLNHITVFVTNEIEQFGSHTDHVCWDIDLLIFQTRYEIPFEFGQTINDEGTIADLSEKWQDENNFSNWTQPKSISTYQSHLLNIVSNSHSGKASSISFCSCAILNKPLTHSFNVSVPFIRRVCASSPLHFSVSTHFPPRQPMERRDVVSQQSSLSWSSWRSPNYRPAPHTKSTLKCANIIFCIEIFKDL